LMQFYFELAKGSLQTLEDLLALAWLYGQKWCTGILMILVAEGAQFSCTSGIGVRLGRAEKWVDQTFEWQDVGWLLLDSVFDIE
jgi:hypothetical protein